MSFHSFASMLQQAFRFFNVKIVGGSRWCVLGMKNGGLLCSIPSSKLGDV